MVQLVPMKGTKAWLLGHANEFFKVLGLQNVMEVSYVFHFYIDIIFRNFVAFTAFTTYCFVVFEGANFNAIFNMP
jgi:hypothetical protein